MIKTKEMSLLFIRHGKTAGNLKKRYVGGRTDEPLCEEGIRDLKAKRAVWTKQNSPDSTSGTAHLMNHATADTTKGGWQSSGHSDLSCPAARHSLLFVSPMLRCRMTAEILCPDLPEIIIPGFRECDFGSFENKNYQELAGDPDYQKWIDSNATLPFPGGESPDGFCERTRRAFHETLASYCGVTAEQLDRADIRLVNAEEAGFYTLSSFRKDTEERETAGNTKAAEAAESTEHVDTDPKNLCIFVVHGGTIMAVLSDLLGGEYYDYQIENGGMAELSLQIYDSSDA